MTRRSRHKPAAAPVTFRAVKPRTYGSAEAVIADAIKQVGGVERVAAILDLRPSHIYGFTDPLAKGSKLSLERARRLTFIEKIDAFACDFAALAGGVFLSPDSVAKGEELAQLGGDISHSMGDLVAELLKAIADGRLSTPERTDLRRRTDTAIAALVALRERLTERDAP